MTSKLIVVLDKKKEKCLSELPTSNATTIVGVRGPVYWEGKVKVAECGMVYTV